ncbi:hypothetical protein T440DRAFT_467094 [Plenodomus tracheiphilus IPT5]|uniref:Uncharacterized protein n=1 Tax=Plenodomus tracheiphilus IPT5 TaxID=1408161 RepID=A0A6A7BD61_9PLEO|nr:hypothetical protein T440DRAFT_467094 [Plenodomus tracheiphilus IPT5]
MPAAVQTRRPMPRIVPAIPHRLARAPPAVRPLTPDESHKGAVAAHEPQAEPPTAEEKQSDAPADDQRAPADDAPWTPDSRASGAGRQEQPDAPALASSPPTSHDGGGEEAQHAPEAPVNGHVKANGHTDDSLVAPSDDSKPLHDHTQRKLAVPAQLPPPFYPSHPAGAHTPPDSREAQTQFHQHQLSAGAVEFRSANDSPALPVAPQDLELQAHVQQHSLPPPPPGFAPQQYAPFFQGHSHHPSEVGAPWLPAPTAPPHPVYESGSEYANPYNGHFPEDPAFTVNGVAASQSQSSNKAQFNDAKPGSEHGEDPHTLAYQNGSTTGVSHLEESAFELAAYLSTQFGNPEFADFILQIRSPESALISVPVHGIVVVRSPVIAEAACHSAAPSHRSRDARRLIDVLASDAFATRESLEEAVKVLYGAPLLTARNFLFGLAPYMYESEQAGPSIDARRRMQQILSYMAAARTLQLPIMLARGVDIARMLLRWDTVDLVLRYTLRAGPATRSRIEGPPAEDPFVVALLNSAVDFMAYTFPVDFQLYTFAPELRDLPRLPAFIESRSTSHNPRLSKIRFGDAPPENDVQPHHATGVLSSVLLSLPLPLVDRLLNHRATANLVGWTGAVTLMRNVVNERESRRQKAVQNQPKSAHHGPVAKALFNNLYIEEGLEQVDPSPLHPSGYKLVARPLPAEL